MRIQLEKTTTSHYQKIATCNIFTNSQVRLKHWVFSPLHVVINLELRGFVHQGFYDAQRRKEMKKTRQVMGLQITYVGWLSRSIWSDLAQQIVHYFGVGNTKKPLFFQEHPCCYQFFETILMHMLDSRDCENHEHFLWLCKGKLAAQNVVAFPLKSTISHGIFWGI